MRDETVDGGQMPEFTEKPDKVQYFEPSLEQSQTPESFGGGGRISELALFPLQMVLNPGTTVPLHIFELRYRLLFNRVRDGDSRFGIIFYNGESNALALIGCAAELTRFEPLPDGRIMTNNIGKERFRVLKILEEKPYTRAIVEYIRDNTPREDLTDLYHRVWQELQDVLQLSNRLYDKTLELSPDVTRLAPKEDKAQLEEGVERGSDDWPAPDQLEDFSFAVSQVLDMPVKEQQILLQTRDTADRLRRQSKMLQTARQYLTAQVTIKDVDLKW